MGGIIFSDDLLCTYGISRVRMADYLCLYTRNDFCFFMQNEEKNNFLFSKNKDIFRS